MQNFDNLMTSFNLGNQGNDEKPLYHFVYGSQLYGTLFGIFGRFKVKETGDTCCVSELSLILQNYRGPINLGFKDDQRIYHCQIENTNNIFFALQGMSSIREKSIIFETPIEVLKKDNCLVIFNRLLYPLPDFGFDIEQRAKHGVDDPIGGSIPRDEYFDSEFYHRNGIDYYYAALRPGMFGYKNVQMPDPKSEEIDTKLMFPAGRCHESNVNLHF